MTTIFGDPADFADEQFAGWLDLYADRVRGVHGGAVALRKAGASPEVAVVVGGGSGHYPAFCGVVGPGFAAGAVVGNIFTSPSAAQVYSVAKAAHQGRGVILTFGNYAGDVMNFGLAAERLRAEGVDTRIVLVTDDVASATDLDRRRGIAGDFSVFKAMGASAAEGAGIDEVERVGHTANRVTRTLGVAFSGCTLPGAPEPLFTVPAGHLALGLGIHGEPGITDVPMLRAAELADLLVNRLLSERPAGADGRIAPILNGLGATKYEELFLLWGHVNERLRSAGLTVIEPEVGELVTSLDMRGCSLTLQWLDDELERLWRADAYTPAYRKLAAPVLGLERAEEAASSSAGEEAVPASTEASRGAAVVARRALDAMGDVLVHSEQELGRIDAVAGDGDHGRGMVKGVTAAIARVDLLPDGAGIGTLLDRAGDAWAEHAGGTSGVLWGAALSAFGARIGDGAVSISGADLVDAAQAFADAIQHLGQATLGDKTLLDALLPFVQALRDRVAAGDSLAVAWDFAAQRAVRAGAATADLRPRVGRARPLADKSVGTPDAGAISLGLILVAVGGVLAQCESRAPSVAKDRTEQS